MHNMPEVFRDMYEALGVTDVDRLMKAVPEDEPRPTDPAQENINAMDNIQLKAFEGQNHQAHITAHLVFGSSGMVAQMPNVAIALQKHVMEHVKIAAQEQAAQQVAQMPQMPPEQMELQVAQMEAQFMAEGMQQVKQLSGQISGEGQQQPDPLVELKKQELQLDAQEQQSDAELERAKLQLDAQNQQMRSDQFQQRLASQERQTQQRIQSAMERELLKLQNQQRGQ